MRICIRVYIYRERDVPIYIYIYIYICGRPVCLLVFFVPQSPKERKLPQHVFHQKACSKVSKNVLGREIKLQGPDFTSETTTLHHFSRRIRF